MTKSKKNAKPLVHAGPAIAETDTVKADTVETDTVETDTVEHLIEVETDIKAELDKVVVSPTASRVISLGVDAVVDIRDLRVDLKLNPRHGNNYDIPTMVELIRTAGRINNPIFVRKSDLTVYQGTRRTLAGQLLESDPSISAELRYALEHVRVIVFDGLKPDEELSLVYDHGATKQLADSEVILSIWNLNKLFFTEAEIREQMYFSVANLTGKANKIFEIQRLEGAAKTKALLDWLHGTIGNWILRVNKLGPYIKDQFVLQFRAKEGLLEDGQKVELQTILKREIVAELLRCKKEDQNGKGWTPENGGIKFNEYVEKLRLGQGVPKRKQPSAKDLKTRADSFMDYGIRAALKYAAGEPEDMDKAAVVLNELDAVGYRRRKIQDTLSECIGNVTDDQVVKLVHAIVKGDPDDVVAALEVFSVK